MKRRAIVLSADTAGDLSEKKDINENLWLKKTKIKIGFNILQTK